MHTRRKIQNHPIGLSSWVHILKFALNKYLLWKMFVSVSALKPEDCMGVHCEIAATYRGALDCCTKLEFYKISLKDHRARDTVISGRTF
ncbi:hypothetical protein P5673_012781 [Acropora cervicornis]|uniref:Uncharacterized protein n=1 Tax=Acropora cervicornis TaxID=6130 RepID=A0AAD9V756_ACRCE|nr:hypothetical protein P5673_012781 [Acropora cervicornis]